MAIIYKTVSEAIGVGSVALDSKVTDAVTGAETKINRVLGDYWDDEEAAAATWTREVEIEKDG